MAVIANQGLKKMQVPDGLTEAPNASTSPSPSPVPVEPRKLPAVRKTHSVRRFSWAWLAILLLSGAGGGGYYAWKLAHPPLPIGISVGNGPIEADEIDIDTKFAGRVAQLLVDI